MRRERGSWRWGLVGLVVVAGLAGCGGGEAAPETTPSATNSDPVETEASEAAPKGETFVWERVEPSAGCLEAMASAADEPDSGAAEPLIVETLSACGSAAEWLSALEREPGALGLTERAAIGRLELEVSCWRNESTPVCADALAVGALDPVE